MASEALVQAPGSGATADDDATDMRDVAVEDMGVPVDALRMYGATVDAGGAATHVGSSGKGSSGPAAEGFGPGTPEGAEVLRCAGRVVVSAVMDVYSELSGV